jgi:protein-S-isoprenylcysteine O-methyltransferase Ste14
MALVVFGPRTWTGGPLLPLGDQRISTAVAILFMVAGAALLFSAICWIGTRNLTPMPCPRKSGSLVETGPFRFVRHPMYSGGVVFAIGWTIFVRGPLTAAYTVAIFVFIDIKARREERWLMEKFADYAAYRRRVRKLIPFIY